MRKMPFVLALVAFACCLSVFVGCSEQSVAPLAPPAAVDRVVPGNVYTWYLGTGPLCAIHPEYCPAITVSSQTGDTLILTGSGTISMVPRMITGEGTYIHRDAAGNLVSEGTWDAEDLHAFQTYGEITVPGFPPGRYGGRFSASVLASTGLEAVLEVTRADGEHVPPSAESGFTMHLPGLWFDEPVSGNAIFVLQP